MENTKLLPDRLIEKSKEAFIMGLEIFNKPTISYRVEGFSFFVCNAWELLLKAKLVRDNGEDSIYYKDNPDRTITLENCVSKIFTNKKDPLRLNLEHIIKLRNTSTHYIVHEYEQIYVPLFQSCVLNYSNKLLQFFAEDITEKVPQNFLTLSVHMKEFDPEQILARYPKGISDRLLKTEKDIYLESMRNNDKYSILIRHELVITKKNDSSAINVRYTSDAEEAIHIVKELKDPNHTHPLTTKSCLDKINCKIIRESIPFKDPKGNTSFNNYHFNLFAKFYNLQENDLFCYVHQIGKYRQKTYSSRTIDFIVDEIKKDPENIIKNLKEQTKK